ncbi:hypothetical protein evm_011889 [Chilo suppressalis]|uniref:Pigment dispersing factor n=1 Tax=Chilo suppressalis TaxID=168631 RepID=A0A0S1U1Q4_CHISP|nr:pigment dispersing factor precursor [Chilo suppressalis]RVE43438.1 hypothetical protein evm_011889 [Chilo suppressalis]
MVSALFFTTLLILLTVLPKVWLDPRDHDDYDYEYLANGAPEELPYGTDNEYTRRIHAMIDAYRGGATGRMVIETNALVNTKYRTWKRNADLINSLLALPKGMNDAGRR